MLENILNLDGVSVLNKNQQKAINGNGCGFIAGYYDSSGNLHTYTFYSDVATKDDVESGIAASFEAGGQVARWCCASCESASWLDL